MPVDRSVQLSISQMSELIGIDPARFIGFDVDRQSSLITVVMEPLPTEVIPETQKTWLNAQVRSQLYTKAERK